MIFEAGLSKIIGENQARRQVSTELLLMLANEGGNVNRQRLQGQGEKLNI